jgi:hypothetical protein
VINSLSLVLVIVAAVTLALGWFQDGLALVYVSIATCLVALALIGVDRLLRRRAPATAPAGYAAASAGAAAVARPRATPDTGARPEVGGAGDDEGDVHPDPVATRSSGAALARESRGTTVVGTRTHRRVADEDRAVRATTSRRGVARRATAPTDGSDGDAPDGGTDATHATGATGPGEVRSPAELEQVRGLGPAKRGALLERFGSVEAIAAATPDELSRTPGIGAGLARAIKDQLG